MDTTLWNVAHEAFVADDLKTVNSVVNAPSRQSALDKYNALAKMRSKFPYMWNEVAIGAVTKLEIQIP